MSRGWGALSRFIKLLGADDVTPIGHVGDRLKVDASGSVLSAPTLSSNLRYSDFNVSNGGIARNTVFTTGAAEQTVFKYDGTGVFFGFFLNLESSNSSSQNWTYKLTIDGNDIFEPVLNSQDLVATTIYDLNSAGSREPAIAGIEFVDTVLYFTTPPGLPILFNTNVTINTALTAGATGKKFKAGLAIIRKGL